MVSLPNGCSCSELSVHPSNWNTKGANVKTKWYIHYRFYDPVNCPKGKLVQIKAGINRMDNLFDKRELVRSYVAKEKNALVYEGYNPVLKACVTPTDTLLSIEPTTPFIQALKEAHKKVKVAKRTYDDITAIIRTIQKAAVLINLNYTPIAEVKRKHIKLLLEQVGKLSRSWSAHNYNKYRTYLMILYKELLEQEAIESNILKDISTQKKVKRMRPVLTDEQRPILNAYLKEKYYRFWLFLNIFFHSGSRISEIMLLKGASVDLQKQKFKIMVLKGVEYKEIEHTIKNVALPYWIEAMKDCKPDQFVFSEGLKPGAKAIRSDQITKRWYRLVKQKLGIDADFYSLKHLNTDETAGLLSLEDAQKHIGHSSPVITMTYAVGEKERQHEKLKKVGNTFA